MKMAVLSYENSGNFGDEIQSIAAARLLPRVDGAIPRERLQSFPLDVPYFLVMNGFFDDKITEFPPQQLITPLYISFHIDPVAAQFYTSPECIAHFQKHAPIGCRDKNTMQILQSAGIDAYYSRCLTLTFPKRKGEGKDRLICVDLPTNKKFIKLVSKYTHSPVTFLIHRHEYDVFGYRGKTKFAATLLQFYEEHAALVATSRLHCALPCIAMGIPVLWFGGAFDARTSILEDFGVKVHDTFHRSRGRIGEYINERRLRDFVWSSPTSDIEKEKAELTSLFKAKTAFLL